MKMKFAVFPSGLALLSLVMLGFLLDNLFGSPGVILTTFMYLTSPVFLLLTMIFGEVDIDFFLPVTCIVSYWYLVGYCIQKLFLWIVNRK